MARIARPDPQERRPHYIRDWRKARGWSQAKLCEKLGEVSPPYTLSEGQLSRIESGEQQYTQDLLEALTKVFGIELPQLLAGGPQAPHVPSDVVTLWGRFTKPREQNLAKRLWESVEPDIEPEVDHLGASRDRSAEEAKAAGIERIHSKPKTTTRKAPARSDKADRSE